LAPGRVYLIPLCLCASRPWAPAEGLGVRRGDGAGSKRPLGFGRRRAPDLGSENMATPDPNLKVLKPQKQLAAKKGAPAEVRFHRAVCKGKELDKQYERWHKAHANSPYSLTSSQSAQVLSLHKEQIARSKSSPSSPSSASAQGAFTTSYQQQNQSGIRMPQYVLPLAEELRHAGIYKIASDAAIKKEMEGDHTRGIRGSKPHFHSTYMDIGQGTYSSLSRSHEVAMCGLNRSAGVPPAEIPPKDVEGDHTQGIRGCKPHFFSTYMDIGENERVAPWMGGKHQHSLAEERRNAGVPPKEVPPKAMEGDFTSGIHGPRGHFATEYQNFGRFQKFDGKRYDLGAVAYKNFRLTIPASRPATGADK